MMFSADRLSVAPMMDWTDRHFRYFIRCFSRRIRLYSEMITAQAVVFGNAEKLLTYNEEEHPIALQLGGADPELLAKACHIAKSFGYDEINLNAGCPSERVASGCFGASLRKDPQLIADCLKAMKENAAVPVTLKTRIALQEETPDSDGYDNLCRCAELTGKAGCQTFIIHARKARLKGFTPKQNRERLPLNYELVYRFKRDFPRFTVSINGDITSLEQAKEHLNCVDGVMIGRAMYANPYLAAMVDQKIFEENTPVVSRIEAIQKMLPYLEKETAKGVRPHLILRHWLGLFKGLPGAALWRRTLTETMFSENCHFKTVAETLNNVISSF